MKKSLFTLIVLALIVIAGGVGCPSYIPILPLPVVYYNSLTVNNTSSHILCGIYISPTSSDNWGANQLSAYLYPGHYTTFTGIANGSYDLKAVSTTGACTTNTMYMSGGNSYTWTIFNAKSGESELESVPVEPTGPAVAPDDTNQDFQPGDSDLLK